MNDFQSCHPYGISAMELANCIRALCNRMDVQVAVCLKEVDKEDTVIVGVELEFDNRVLWLQLKKGTHDWLLKDRNTKKTTEQPMTNLMSFDDWAVKCQDDASNEGWGLFDADGKISIQRVDCPEPEDDGTEHDPVFESDTDAIAWMLQTLSQTTDEDTKNRIILAFLLNGMPVWNHSGKTQTQHPIPQWLADWVHQ